MADNEQSASARGSPLRTKLHTARASSSPQGVYSRSACRCVHQEPPAEAGCCVCRSDPQTPVAGPARDVGSSRGVLTGGNVILSASSRSPRRPLRGAFRSRGNSRPECSTDSPAPASESTGSHEPASVGSSGDSGSWNDSDLCCDRVH